MNDSPIFQDKYVVKTSSKCDVNCVKEVNYCVNKEDKNKIENKKLMLKVDNRNSKSLKWNHIHKNNLNLSSMIMYPNINIRRIIFQKLQDQIEYLTEPHVTKIRIQGKLHPIPRKQAAYGDKYCNDKELTYTYSGLKLTPRPWRDAPILEEIRNNLKAITGIQYNFVLVNCYKNGNDKMGHHKDDEKEIDKTVPIASISFGQKRIFNFKTQKSNSKDYNTTENLEYNIVLEDGMLLLMKPPTNDFWFHGIPRKPLNICPNMRINLTFRQIVM